MPCTGAAASQMQTGALGSTCLSGWHELLHGCRVGEGFGGWHQVNILVDEVTGKRLDEDYRVLQPGSLVVLTRQRPPGNAHAMEWLLRWVLCQQHPKMS